MPDQDEYLQHQLDERADSVWWRYERACKACPHFDVRRPDDDPKHAEELIEHRLLMMLIGTFGAMPTQMFGEPEDISIGLRGAGFKEEFDGGPTWMHAIMDALEYLIREPSRFDGAMLIDEPERWFGGDDDA